VASRNLAIAGANKWREARRLFLRALNVTFWIRHYIILSSRLFAATHSPVRTSRIYGILARKILLFLEPVLPSTARGEPDADQWYAFAAALFVIEIRAHGGTNRGNRYGRLLTSAVTATTCSLRTSARKNRPSPFEKSDFGLVIFQPLFFGLDGLLKRLMEEVKKSLCTPRLRVSDTGAQDHFDLGLQIAGDADLPVRSSAVAPVTSEVRLFYFT